jgi:hypothetical protein
MKRQTYFFVVLAVLAFAGNGFSQSGGIIDSVVNVIAKDGIFIVGGTGKEPFSQQACALPEVFNFLDSAGATYITQIFPGFDPAETLTVNQEGDTVKLIDLSQYYQIEFDDSVWWEDLCSAWVAIDNWQGAYGHNAIYILEKI